METFNYIYGASLLLVLLNLFIATKIENDYWEIPRAESRWFYVFLLTIIVTPVINSIVTIAIIFSNIKFKYYED